MKIVVFSIFLKILKDVKIILIKLKQLKFGAIHFIYQINRLTSTEAD